MLDIIDMKKVQMADSVTVIFNNGNREPDTIDVIKNRKTGILGNYSASDFIKCYLKK